MPKHRTLSEAEQAARKKYEGMTRREFRAKHSKFNRPAKTNNGSYEVVAVFDNNPVPQTAPFPNEAAALARFERLASNPNVTSLKVIQNVIAHGADGKTIGMRQVAIYSLEKYGQQFANSKAMATYKEKGGNTTMTLKVLKASPRLMSKLLCGELEVAKISYEGGQPWWERRA